MIIEFDDNYFMSKAVDEAKTALSKGEVPIGAVIVAENKIIARAHNMVEALKDVTAHAEILAITSASNYIGGKYLENCSIYVTLEPCQMCAGALYWSRISKIFFGAADPKRGFKILGIKVHPKTKVQGGILQKECKDLLDKFFISRRNMN